MSECFSAEMKKNIWSMPQPFKVPDRLEFGVDEAGRGCLMSRVYTAAVCWPADLEHKLIRDSKKMRKSQREWAYDYIKQHALAYCVDYAEVEEIDTHNILGATMRSMKRAIHGCHLQPDHLLIDGNRFTPYIDVDDLVVPHDCVIKGDDTYLSIAAASILAKVSRDRYVTELCEREPILKEYGIHRNMGYGTAEHMEAIRRLGITRHHRKSFAPCKEQ